MQDIVERLEHAPRWTEECACHKLMREAASHIRQLREALTPFVKAASCAEPDESDEYSVAGSSARYEMTLGDLRRAVSAVA